MAFLLSWTDVAKLTKLVRGQPNDESVTGVRTLSGVDNNLLFVDYGAADTPFLRLTDAHYGAFDVASGNFGVNPLYAGLDPRNISNVIGQQELGLPKAENGANVLFTAFGQYFDHGLSFVAKGGAGTIQIGAPGTGFAPGSDNPADLTRATVIGLDANGVPQHLNKTSNFIDQNQAYGSNDLVGTFLRETDGHGGVNARLASGGDDPSSPGFKLLPSLRELINMHWENDTRFSGGGVDTTFRAHFAGLVDSQGVINEAMLPGLYKDFMGSGQPLLIDLNPFISPLDHIVAGDGRVNENITLTSVHTIWARNHNFHVTNLEASGFVGTAEELFQAAKIINETEYQRVIYTEFADVLLGGMRGSGSHGWGGYNPNADPGISHEFAAAAYRFGHSMVTQTIQVKDENGQVIDVALFDAFLNPTNDGQFQLPNGQPTTAQALGAMGYVPQPGYEQLGVSSILRGINRQAAEEVDANVVDAIRNDLVRISADLFSFNVARDRDLGLGSLNQVRTDLLNSLDPYVREAVDRWAGNMSAYTSWEDLQTRNNLSDSLIAQLKEAYPDLVLSTPEEIAAFKLANPDITLVNGNTVKGIDRVDLWVGGLVEKHINGGMVGQTFWVILHEQLDRLQEADRFYYKDRVDNFAFYDQIDGGAEQGFGAIIARNTGIVWGGENVFLVDNKPPEVVQFAPTDGAVNVDVNANILLTFNEAIHFGQGVIELRLANGTHVESFVIGSSPRVTIAGRLLTIDPTQTLLGNSEYNIIISQGVVLDGSDNAFAGTSTYDFTTKFIAITGDQQANVLTGTAGGDEIFGLDGNDWLNGLDGNDRLDGGTGADQMTGGAGDDIIDGDAGNDYIEGGPGNDLLIGGADIDTVSYAAAPAVVVVNPMGGAITLRGVTVDLRVTVAQDTFAAGLDTLDGIENIIGTPYDDILTGDDNANVIEGLSGADVINGGAGDDTIVDVIGADTINGGAGTDTIRLSATSAALNAMTNAALTNVEAINAATAAAGVVVNLGLQTEGFAVTGSAFNDTLTGGAGVDNVNAGAGDDTILGVVGADTINGGAGTDTIRITATSAALNAMTDARLINVEAIDASTAAAGVVVNLSNQTEGFTFTGSAFADTFTGTGAADTIVGVVGADTINGGAGTDTIRLTATSADLNAMTNARLINVEAIDASTAAAGVVVNLSNQTEGFTFTGSAFADTFTGTGAADTIVGVVGADTINGGAGTDTIRLTATSADLNAMTNARLINVEAIDASTAAAGVTVSLANQSENFIFRGSAFADNLSGGSGADNMAGGAGVDTINGGVGNDTLNGGLGNDVMTGGGGSDIFRFDTAIAGGGNVDRITDYNVAADSMQLSRAIFTGLATTGGGQLAASAFSLNAARGNAAQIVYNTNTGALFYDSNGAAGGGATQFGTLTSPTGTINNQEFFLV